jgi:hypothetical protein
MDTFLAAHWDGLVAADFFTVDSKGFTLYSWAASTPCTNGRCPSVVTWHDGEMVYLILSGKLPSDVLVRIANSLYTA